MLALDIIVCVHVAPDDGHPYYIPFRNIECVKGNFIIFFTIGIVTIILTIPFEN